MYDPLRLSFALVANHVPNELGPYGPIFYLLSCLDSEGNFIFGLNMHLLHAEYFFKLF